MQNSVSAQDQNHASISYVRYAKMLGLNLRRYYRLLTFLIFVALLAGFAVVVLDQPSYVAVATIGPPPSSLDQLTSMAGGLSALGSGFTKKLGLGGESGDSNSFDQYTQLLTSNRVAAKIAQDPRLLRAIFYRQYDWARHTWKASDGLFDDISNIVKGWIHYPVKAAPDQDDVARFLAKHVMVDAPLTSSFVTVSISAESPFKAQWLLSSLLLDADVLIRDDKRKDVNARIQYLVQVLPGVTQSDLRQSLIQILSQQEQTMMVLEADNRYASALVDAPHADLLPDAPKISTVFGISVILAFMIWGVLIWVLPEEHWLLSRFLRQNSKHPFVGYHPSLEENSLT